jgi:DNA-binding transcriptional regulator YiaG
MAKLLSTSQANVCRWESGMQAPSSKVARKYEIVTNGKVRLQDFPALKGSK